MGYAVCNIATCLKALNRGPQYERPGSASRQSLYGSKQSKSVWQQIWLVCQASSRCRKTAAADTTGASIRNRQSQFGCEEIRFPVEILNSAFQHDHGEFLPDFGQFLVG